MKKQEGDQNMNCINLLKNKLARMLALFLFQFTVVAQEERDIAHGPPPPPKPKRVSAAETFPPLPLPVVPLRRSEPKRSPQPLALIAKIKYCDGIGWQGHITDLKRLFDYANKVLKIRYTNTNFSLEKFSFDPTELPMIYFTGHRSVKFNNEERKKLRQYLLNGGTIIGNSCCGNSVFNTTFTEEMEKIFPKRPFKLIPLDHPLYSSFYKIEKIKYYRNGKFHRTDYPRLKGINYGCRLVVIFSPTDIGSGWNRLLVKDSKESIAPDDALKIGTNIIAYVLAYRQYGRLISKKTVYESIDKKIASEFVFAQLIHDGDWDPHPWGITNLTKKLTLLTMVDTKFYHKALKGDSHEIFNYPFLYITGHNDFSLTNEEINNLREYLKRGGFILINNCCSRNEFDIAVRREIKKLLPSKDFIPIPHDHPVFFSFYNVSEINYTTPLQNQLKNKLPSLEGITIGNQLVLVYSKYGLNLGGLIRPYVKAILPEDSFKLAINVVMYALSH